MLVLKITGRPFFDEDAANGNQEGEVPESSANLANGPVGYGLSSVVWPGPLASNAGGWRRQLIISLHANSQSTKVREGAACFGL